MAVRYEFEWVLEQQKRRQRCSPAACQLDAIACMLLNEKRALIRQEKPATEQTANRNTAAPDAGKVYCYLSAHHWTEPSYCPVTPPPDVVGSQSTAS